MLASQWAAITQLQTEIDADYAHLRQTTGLSTPALHALLALYKRDGQHATSLAASIGYPATSFTPIVDRLELRGFVERHEDAQDRRAVCIWLTARAQDRRDQITTEAAQIEDAARSKAAQWAAQYQIAG